MAKTAGFCFGVKRAVDQVYEQIEKAEKPVCTYGPIIHNREVVRDLEEKGVRVLGSFEELEQLSKGTVIIRSHGVGRHVYEILEKNQIRIVDATCPFVKKIHRIVQEQEEKGRRVVIVGDREHPEVQGICGWSQKGALVIKDASEMENLPVSQDESLCLLAQTTFNYNKFQDLVEIISEKSYDIIVLNTICNATKERQTETRQIAEEADAMIVIGDKHSSNTQKLFEICAKACKDTYYIQTLDDLNLNQLGSVETVGITAGASTPNNIIEEVQRLCRN